MGTNSENYMWRNGIGWKSDSIWYFSINDSYMSIFPAYLFVLISLSKTSLRGYRKRVAHILLLMPCVNGLPFL